MFHQWTANSSFRATSSPSQKSTLRIEPRAILVLILVVPVVPSHRSDCIRSRGDVFGVAHVLRTRVRRSSNAHASEGKEKGEECLKLHCEYR
ncbi:hypothetical protein VFPBJ_09867 [Purpureocillium lilacinum]|uniref:Uncharacterized protein n=1 Tax=Purpureocillium lilacinum TaxID=33203 RepID=A0A179G9T2_PURLI|nr:hypothetical protein VFPBJ_09867 [Purpureocillium lilacinum]